ncbi:hypothetical protein GCK72_005452 [Caenorhabditis remanei]|uniref:RecF/RecN/SMC N-terminal domain-containing protein n=1 Tax=Caenorhabditis remanei TaxID=31234 RepID=A0A6A5HCK5_CAERE|nr:hypothetical protein GCK72_005452 [Caenorhabditis remanei]KAF1765500.1 hypothetical protein GCK72_005452 [Caenorhabditis remanei]
MYIKTILLDGFKSYQKPTEIKGFSPQFNAITGYNGSGKSNVLDSICFILGINKLDNIRAKSMSELISHGGTKATVQIRFDNSDKSVSPFGMEHLDEIVVQRTITAQATGKGCATSYTLNGHASTNSKIQDFFRGIGLNVNNPHFLIMQGRITTVLNMKPEEILGMVEEAAGTKMYDQKKKDAEKTMFLKEVKLKEIDRIYDESIAPRMNKFREDRKNMVEVTRLNKVKEIAQRKLEAFQYYQALENVKRDIEASEEVKKQLDELDQKIVSLNEEMVKKEEEKKELERLRDNPVEETALAADHKEKHSIAMRLEQEQRATIDSIKILKKEIERIGKNIEKEKEHMVEKRDALEESKKKNNHDIETHKNDEELVEKLRNELESITRGTVANEKGEHVSLESMIQETRSQVSKLETNVKMAESRKNRFIAKRDQVKAELEKITGNNAADQKAVDEVAQQTDELSGRIQALGFDSDEDNRLKDRKQVVEEKIKELENLNSRLLSKTMNGRYTGNFTNPPVLGFNAKTDVLGLLVHLVKIKPGCEEFGVAIDIALGGSVSR